MGDKPISMAKGRVRVFCFFFCLFVCFSILRLCWTFVWYKVMILIMGFG